MKKNLIKYFIGLLVCLLVRLIPFRPPNIEPITSTLMPFSKKWGWLSGATFGFVSVFVFDLFTNFGIWTYITATMYALMGIAAGLYFKNRKAKIIHYVGFAFVGTLVFDFITGPIMSSLVFKMPFMVALIGQIPFTLLHLCGNIILSATISPLLYKWVISNKNLEWNNLFYLDKAKEAY